MKAELILFQENKVEVLKRLKDGRIDYLDLTSWSFQDRLFSPVEVKHACADGCLRDCKDGEGELDEI